MTTQTKTPRKSKSTTVKKAKPTKPVNANSESAATSAFQSIPLNKLTLSPKNVRKSKTSEADEVELKNSIERNGLKQNLVVHFKGKDSFLVNAGGRRLKALQALAEQGSIAKDFPIGCLVEPEDDATLTSAIENTHRSAMHPADQYAAFSLLIEEGRTEEEISLKFGVSVDVVRKRLKLARVAPEIFEAFRENEISLEMIMAFTLSDDQERQLSVWAMIKDGQHCPAYMIKSRMTENTYKANSKLAKFVGLEVYNEAGGTITTDLFVDRDNTYLNETALLERLASEKLNTIAKTYQGKWKWVDAILELDHDAFRSFGRIYPQNSEPDPKHLAKINKLKERDDDFRELEQTRDLTQEEHDEYYSIDDEIEKIEAQIKDEQPFDEDNQKHAGVIVTLDFRGNVEINKGLVRPEDLPHLKSENDDDDTDNDRRISTPTSSLPTPSSDTAAIARRSEGITAGLASDLRSSRHFILRAHLAGDFTVAFNAMLYTICSQAFSHKYLSDMPVDTAVNSYYDVNQKKLVKGSIADKMLTSMKLDLRLEWTNLPQPEDFKALCALPMEDKQALFAWATAYSIKAQLASDDRPNKVIEEIGSQLDVNVAECWRPTAANYWGTVTKAHIASVAKELISDPYAQERLSEKKVRQQLPWKRHLPNWHQPLQVLIKPSPTKQPLGCPKAWLLLSQIMLIPNRRMKAIVELKTSPHF